jgi:uncharacterized protein (TIGR04255 family)
MKNTTNPLNAPPPPEIHLDHAPLIRVIAQVRFPQLLEIEDREAIGKFRKALAGAYPILRSEQIQGFEIGPEGMQPVKPKVAWRFSDMSGKWRVGLSSDFLALDTDNYLDRADFIARLELLVKALEETFDPKQIDRFGIRYVDRLDEAAIKDLESLVRPEIRGIVGTEISENISHFMSESILDIGENRLMARWGVLPPGGTFDPAVVEPIQQRSWVLDVDMFSGKPTSFSVQTILENSKIFSDRIYSFFRWAVTDEFIKRYGGKNE